MANVKCARDACACDARWQLGFRLWAKGRPRIPAEALTGLFSIGVCDTHRLSTVIGDLLSEDGKAAIAQSLKALGRAAPDFASALPTFTAIKGGTLAALT